VLLAVAGGGVFEAMSSRRSAAAHIMTACCWRITHHNPLAALADLCPQWLLRDHLPLPPNGGIPRETTRSLSPPSAASLRAEAAGRSLRRSKVAIKRPYSPDRHRDMRKLQRRHDAAHRKVTPVSLLHLCDLRAAGEGYLQGPVDSRWTN